MTKRSGKVKFGEGGTKVFLLQPIVANEEASTCRNRNNGEDEDNDDEEMIEERRLNKMRNCTQEKWHELHRSFLLTNAFSEDGRKSLLRYYDVEDYFNSYMNDAPSESFKYMSMLRAISYTCERRVSLPLVKGHHRSTTLFHLVCSAKVDTTEGKTVHNTLN